MKDLRQILVTTILKLKGVIETEDEIVGLYPYGSVLYGSTHEKSDYDFVVIIKSEETVYEHHSSNDYDIHVLSIDKYLELLDNHNILALETHFNPFPIIEFKTDFTLDLVKLRHKISAVVSNSWGKSEEESCIRK